MCLCYQRYLTEDPTIIGLEVYHRHRFRTGLEIRDVTTNPTKLYQYLQSLFLWIDLLIQNNTL